MATMSYRLRKRMKCFFSNPDFESQMIRLLHSAKNQGADPCECMQTLGLIDENKCDTWYSAWITLAEKVRKEAEEKGGQSAKETFLRASNYYRQAYSFLYFESNDPRILETEEMQNRCFLKADVPSINLGIGNLYPASNEKGPVLIVNQGYEGNKLDSFFTFHQAATQHGFHLVTFDGPGQGEHLIHKDSTMSLRWEQVIGELIDKLKEIPLVGSIALIGIGWGSFLAAQAATKETRLDALILAPGIIDPLIGVEKVLPDFRKKLDEGNSTAINTLFGQAMTNKMYANKLKMKMLAHQVDTPFDLYQLYSQWKLDPTLIRCPTLVFNATEDPMLKDQGLKIYELISSDKKALHPLPTTSLLPSGHQSLLFDWLDAKVKK